MGASVPLSLLLVTVQPRFFVLLRVASPSLNGAPSLEVVIEGAGGPRNPFLWARTSDNRPSFLSGIATAATGFLTAAVLEGEEWEEAAVVSDLRDSAFLVPLSLGGMSNIIRGGMSSSSVKTSTLISGEIDMSPVRVYYEVGGCSTD